MMCYSTANYAANAQPANNTTAYWTIPATDGCTYPQKPSHASS